MSLQRLSEWFESQIGVSEDPPDSNNVIYNTDFYGNAVSGPQYPWCVAFVWDGFRECGMSENFCGGQKTAYCPYIVTYAKLSGQWVIAAYKWGDLLLYDWDGDGVADHIGFCYAVDGSTLTTIEGNVDSRVMKLTRQASQVMGAYRPNYGDVFTGDDIPTEPEPDTYVVKPGDTLWGIAWDHGMTSTELARINGIDPNKYIYPGQVLKLREDAPEEPTPEPVAPAPPGDDVYIVQPGDTLWGIAQKEMGKGWKWWRIAEANGLKDPYTIYPGQKLVIPKDGD